MDAFVAVNKFGDVQIGGDARQHIRIVTRKTPFRGPNDENRLITFPPGAHFERSMPFPGTPKVICRIRPTVGALRAFGPFLLEYLGQPISGDCD